MSALGLTTRQAEGRGEWIFPDPASPLSVTERMALRFLDEYGPHCVGVISNDEEFCAAIVFEGLKRRGHALAGLGDDGPTYRITTKGRAELQSEAA